MAAAREAGPGEHDPPACSTPVLIADVAVATQGGGDGLFSYTVPEALAAVMPGHLVEAPFGPRSVQGVVFSVGEHRPERPLRPLTALLDPLPVLTPAGLTLVRWLAQRYGEGLTTALATALPPGVTHETSYTISLLRSAQEVLSGARLTQAQRELVEVVAAAPQETIALADLERELGREAVLPALTGLLRRKLVARRAGLGRAGSSARTERVITLDNALLGAPGRALKGRQAEVMAWLVEQGGQGSMKDLSRAVPGASAAAAALLRKGLLQEDQRPLRRDPLAHRPLARSEALAMTEQQQTALAALRGALRQGRAAAGGDAYTSAPRGPADVFLLHGVTGSGKTEVYLQALEECFALGRQAMVLVPEISLTPQTIARFASRFPGKIALLHSKLSLGERYDEWDRLRQGQAQAVVGARSAIFAPLPNPGLIILDEEHDPSYKQSSGLRYHTRDVALELGRLTGSVVVLGSATPDVISYHRATRGDYTLLEMPRRVAPTGMPPVRIVDLRQELRAGNRSMFSRALVAAVRGSLERGEQAILYINRRGASSFIICRDCGFVVKCQACDLPFTYHSATRELICHRCDARAEPPELCPRCRGWRIRYFGLGTQKVEEEAANVFPEARLLRWDRDVATTKHGHEQVLDRFANYEADILIGTQMVAKGLDIPLVTTVGVVSADGAINLPDFRSAETAFQLLTQVAGRAGRATGSAGTAPRPGQVVVQTYSPEHFAIVAAARHDYLSFYRDEIRFRAEASYPPFARLLRLLYADRAEARCQERAEALATLLRGVVERGNLADTEIIGPAPCFVSKIRYSYQWQVLARGQIDALLPHVPRDWTRDVDPVSLL